MIVPVARVAASAIAGSLAFCSGRNMLQTYSISRETAVLPVDDLPIATLAEMPLLPRRQLLQMYMHRCEVPIDMDALDGDWHGVLLNNNGLVKALLGGNHWSTGHDSNSVVVVVVVHAD